MTGTIHERAVDGVLAATSKYNCGQSLVTLLPTVLFFVCWWMLSEIYIGTFMNRSPRHRQNHRQFGRVLLKNTLILILVWSGGQLWSDGLLRFLNAYTFDFLNMINCHLKTYWDGYSMDNDRLKILETVCKMLVCFIVVALLRWSYLHVKRHYHYYFYDNSSRRRRRMRLSRRAYRWRTQILLPTREVNELGENGYLLWQDIGPPEPDPESTENDDGPVELKHTISCQLPATRAPKTLERLSPKMSPDDDIIVL